MLTALALWTLLSIPTALFVGAFIRAGNKTLPRRPLTHAAGPGDAHDLPRGAVAGDSPFMFAPVHKRGDTL